MALEGLVEDELPESELVDPGMSSFGFLGYVTLDEADTYVSDHYTSIETFRQGWESLENMDKAVLLRRSFQAIELLPFTGHKTCCDQPFAFPRWPSTEVPDSIKFAQIEQALVGADAETAEDARQYERMWQWGVSTYKIGNLSEHISRGIYGADALKKAGITSATASRLLAPFLQGGYDIR